MAMTEEMLEILIGKSLDGEILPSEHQLLQAEFDANPQAKELFEQLQTLDRASREAVASRVIDEGRSVEAVFDRAWRRGKRRWLPRIIGVRGQGRFFSGVAAGLAFGLFLHFVLVGPSQPTTETIPTMAVVPTQSPILTPTAEELPAVYRNIDWYGFTDKAGNQWLVEGLRTDYVRPAAYESDL